MRHPAGAFGYVDFHQTRIVGRSTDAAARGVNWLIATIDAGRVAILGSIFATAIELIKLLHSPALDALRLTLPGMLLLGRFFSAWDVIAYWLAIFIGYLIDRRIRSAATV
jgi:hypothetical protein